MVKLLSLRAAPHIAVIDGKPTTTSRDISETFGKDHRNVVKRIADLECTDAFRSANFQAYPCVNSQNGQTYTEYSITRDGFAFLCMGFTGAKAAKWKELYINTFNQMAEQLASLAVIITPGQMALDYTRISPAQAQSLKELVQSIVASGVQGYGETWMRLQKKFRVNSYLELSAGQFEQACDYLLAKTGEPVPSLKSRRWLISFDYKGAEQVQAVPAGAAVVSYGELPGMITSGEVPRGLLQSIVLAAVQRLSGGVVIA